MADASIDIPIDQFTNLSSGMSATMLVLLRSLGLEKGDTLTINEVDEFSVPTGNVGYGLVEKIASGQFYNLPDIYNQYYLNPFTLPTWINYSATSTVNGWSSITVKKIFYKVVGDTVYCQFDILGTSNATSASFTLPPSLVPVNISPQNSCRVENNGAFPTTIGIVLMLAGSSTVNCYLNNNAALFASVNTKRVSGLFFYML